jgi:hypothetical protein
MDNHHAPEPAAARDGPARWRIITIDPQGVRMYDEAEWADALVIIDQGEIELEGATGSTLRLSRGASLWLAGVPLRALHNRGTERAVLIAVSRRDRDPRPASRV